ncbi:MAG: hypothetical protein EAS49_12750, partial [Brucella intermedia]
SLSIIGMSSEIPVKAELHFLPSRRNLFLKPIPKRFGHPIRSDLTPMMLKDIQTLEHAARTAMAGNDDPLPVQQRSLKPTHVGLAVIMLAGAAYLLLA